MHKRGLDKNDESLMERSPLIGSNETKAHNSQK